MRREQRPPLYFPCYRNPFCRPTLRRGAISREAIFIGMSRIIA